MKQTLEVPISCGSRTCASRPGKFCRWIATQNFGSVYYCRLFSGASTNFGSTSLRFDSLKEKDGWIQRHPKCLQLEGGSP